MFTRVLPAIIAESQDELDEMLGRLIGKVEWIMLDFMDGKFVPSKALMFKINLPKGFHYEAHLMVKEPFYYLEELRGKVDSVIIHIESDDFKKALGMARDLGYEVSAAINPSTPMKFLEEYLMDLDRVLVMTVEPGRYGAPFMSGALETVKHLRKLAPGLPIEVDGAMNPENARKAKEAGANIFASGSFLVKSSDFKHALRALEEAIK